VRLTLHEAAVLVLRERGVHMLRGGASDVGLLDVIADMAGIKLDEGRHRRVLTALSQRPGHLVKRRGSVGGLAVLIFFLPEHAPSPNVPLRMPPPPGVAPRPDPRIASGLAAKSPEERRRIARLGGLSGDPKKKGLAVMTIERRSAIARMGAAKRKTRHVFTREERIIASRITNHGDTYEDAAAYAAQAILAVTREERAALVATTEADAVASIARAAGRKVPLPGATKAGATAGRVQAEREREKLSTGLQPVPASERDPALIAQLEADLAAARTIKDAGQRELFQLEIGRRLGAATEDRHERKRAMLQAKLDARVAAALERRAERGYDNSEILESLRQPSVGESGEG